MRGTTLAHAAALFLLLVPAKVIADDPYADFRVPESSGFRWLVNGQLGRSSSVSSNARGETRGSAYSPSVNTTLDGFHDSERTSWTLAVQSNIQWSRRQDHSEQRSFGLNRSESRQRGDDQRLSTSWSQSWFASRYFLTTGAVAGTSFSQRLFTSNRRDQFSNQDVRSSDRNTQDDYGVSSTWTLGVGAGRVRLVQGAYDAWDIERRLRANGRLKRPLSNEARTRLAKLYYAGNGLSYAHERSSKYYWRETERILREDGALVGETLDAYALGRLFEAVLPGRAITRTRGVSVMLSASADVDHGHTDFDDGRTSAVFIADTLVASFSERQSQRFRTDRDEILGGIDVNFQRPISERWQFGVRSSARYGAGRKRTTRFTTVAQAGWSIADRWSATSTMQHFATSSRLDGVGYPQRWSFSWDNRLEYQIEDAWALSLSYRIRQDQFRLQSATTTRSDYGRNSSIELGFTYRPAGRFAMPELGIAEHLGPGTH